MKSAATETFLRWWAAKRFMFPPYEFAANYYWPVKPAPAKPAVPAKK